MQTDHNTYITDHNLSRCHMPCTTHKWHRTQLVGDLLGLARLGTKFSLSSAAGRSAAPSRGAREPPGSCGITILSIKLSADSAKGCEGQDNGIIGAPTYKTENNQNKPQSLEVYFNLHKGRYNNKLWTVNKPTGQSVCSSHTTVRNMCTCTGTHTT